MFDAMDSSDQPVIPAGGQADTGENPSLEHWMCGAKNRQGNPCRGPKVKGRTRCRMHGGLSLRGAASPTFKNGSRSRGLAGCLPERFRERYEEAINDPELLSIRRYVALLDARVTDVLEKFAASDAGQFRARLQQICAKMEAANSAKDIQAFGILLKELVATVATGAAEVEAWQEVVAAIRDRNAATAQETKRLIDTEMMLSVEQAMNLTVVLYNVVAEHVKDRKVLSAIGVEIESRFGLTAPR